MTFSAQSQPRSRRHFLRAAGVTIALPWLETFSRAAEPVAVQRFVCMANPFGMIRDAFFPSDSGMKAALPENLAAFEALRGKFTVFSHLDHGMGGGHSGTHAFLSGIKTFQAAGFAFGNETLDQFLGRQAAGNTRFAVLNTSAGSNNGGACELSWTRSGVMVPAVQQVSRLFRLLFVDDAPDAAQGREDLYTRQGSILDAVMEQAEGMHQRLSKRDQGKLDQYLTSVREVEVAIQQEAQWLHRPRPKTTMKEPKDGTVTQQLPVLLDLIALALETDSTRVATVEVPGGFDAKGVGLDSKGYHAYSHHGQDPKLMSGQRKIENYQLDHLARFITKLDSLGLLDSTQVLFGSGMGDGSAHTNSDLPVLLAGGSHRHATHQVLPEEKGRRVPLSNLYLSIAQQFGAETDLFGRSTGTLEVGA